MGRHVDVYFVTSVLVRSTPFNVVTAKQQTRDNPLLAVQSDRGRSHHLKCDG